MWLVSLHRRLAAMARHVTQRAVGNLGWLIFCLADLPSLGHWLWEFPFDDAWVIPNHGNFQKSGVTHAHDLLPKSGLTWVCLGCYSIYGQGYGDCHPSAIVAPNP